MSSSIDLDLKLLEALGNSDIDEAKKILGKLSNANDFLTAVAILHPRNKDDDTVDLYKSLFSSFKKKQSGFVNHSLPKRERLIWNEILIEMSLVLWKWRDNFRPEIWKEIIIRVYEEGLKNIGDGKDKTEGGLCDVCTRAFSQLLFNFASYARETDNSNDFQLTEEKVKKLSKEVGFGSWEEVTHCGLIEDKIRSLRLCSK